MQAANYLNPDNHGRSGPVQLSIFQLKEPEAFKHANVRMLVEQPAIVLDHGLIDKYHMTVRPGEKFKKNFNLASDTRYIGLLGNFHQIKHAKTKRLIPLPDNTKRIHLKLLIESESVAIKKIKTNQWIWQ